ncbi:hypothetical protein ACFL6U_31230 [Planctomycetota bacterium]
MRRLLITMVFCVFAIALTVSAAPISRGPARDVAAASDVSTTGVLVEAFNAGPSGVPNQTVNRVQFIGTGSLLPGNTTIRSFSGSTGNSAYDSLLGTIDYALTVRFPSQVCP